MVTLPLPRQNRRTDETPRGASSRSTTGRHNLRVAVAFLAPTMVLIILLRVVPTIGAVSNSVRSGLPGSIIPPEFVGLDIFRQLFGMESFWASVRQTLLFTAIVNPLQIAIALLIAMLLTRQFPLTGFWRTLVFLPAAIPLSGSAVVWGYALRPSGPINAVLGAIGIPAQPFLTSPDQSLWSIVLISSWVGIGWWMIFLIAGIHDIPDVYYEAAKIDGAGPIRTFFSITLPLLRRTLLLVLVADTVANFVLFAPVAILTRGGPEGSTSFLMYDIFNRTFTLSDPYVASAELVILLVVMIGIVSIQFKLLGSSKGE